MRSIRAGDTLIYMTDLTHFSEPIIYLVAFLTVLGETGIAPLFFLPGDSLLFSLGLFADQGIVDLRIIILVLMVASILGNIIGYYLGSFVRGKRESSHMLQKIPQKHIERTERFYEKYGSWTIVLSRFIPIIRTIAPFLAGVSKMPRRKFIPLSIVGGIAWSIVVPLAGYLFGSYFGAIHAVSLALILMIAASVLTPVVLILSKRLFKRG